MWTIPYCIWTLQLHRFSDGGQNSMIEIFYFDHSCIWFNLVLKKSHWPWARRGLRLWPSYFLCEWTLVIWPSFAAHGDTASNILSVSREMGPLKLLRHLEIHCLWELLLVTASFRLLKWFLDVVELPTIGCYCLWRKGEKAVFEVLKLANCPRMITSRINPGLISYL